MWGKIHIKVSVYKIGKMISIQGQVSNTDKTLLLSAIGQHSNPVPAESTLSVETLPSSDVPEPEPFIQGILLHPHEVIKLFPDAVEAEKTRQRRTTSLDERKKKHGKRKRKAKFDKVEAPDSDDEAELVSPVITQDAADSILISRVVMLKRNKACILVIPRVQAEREVVVVNRKLHRSAHKIQRVFRGFQGRATWARFQMTIIMKAKVFCCCPFYFLFLAVLSPFLKF
jgi:hypothetical protein